MSENKPSKDANTEGSSKEKGPRGNTLLVALVGLNTLITAGGVGLTVLRPAPAAAAAHSSKKGGEHGGGGEHGDKGEKGESDEDAEPASEKEDAEEKDEGEKKGEGEGAPLATSQMMRVEDLVVHLRNPEVDRYARLEIDIEVDTPGALQRLESRRPAVRDAVISYMSERTYEELRGSDGIATLKKAIRERVEPLAPRHVRALYITSFVVQ